MIPAPLGRVANAGGFFPHDTVGATIKKYQSPGDAPDEGTYDVPLRSARGGAPFSVAPDEHFSRTQYPMITGNSVMAIKYADGVMMACDTLLSYGATKRYKDSCRMYAMSDSVLLGASGEWSDFRYIQDLLGELATNDFCEDDGASMRPCEVFSYLQRVMYNRRNKFDPLWNSLVIAGVDQYTGESMLGNVNMIGVNYKDSHVATGFATHLARPLFRDRQTDDMSYEEAKELICDGLKVCYYRDKNTINKFQLATVTKEGVKISDPFSLSTEWEYKAFHNPSEQLRGTW
mmetsp:Transcript_17676/g.60373  ORF Transcript_17676/g.60373 Transcript_17676/m.60373 type:complete len:289 (-) Transcript_17676:69-935(-)